MGANGSNQVAARELKFAYAVAMEAFVVSWRLRCWDRDGVRHDEASVEVVQAPDAWHARDAIRQRSIARFDLTRGPYRLAFDDDALESTLNVPYYPAELPHRHALRGRILAGTSPSALLADLIDGGATRLAIMTGFFYAFDVSPEEAIEDLDAIARQRHVWSRAFRIRETFEQGGSVTELLHVLYSDGTCCNSIPLGIALRDALDLDFSDTKMLIDLACHRDPSFDRELIDAIERERQRT